MARSAGAGGFLTARHSTTQLARETNANREAWLVQTQLLAAVGTLTAVVLILLMAAVPLLLDLPLRSAPDSRGAQKKGR